VKRSLDLLKVKRATFVIGQDRRIAEVINSELSMNTHADNRSTHFANCRLSRR